MITGQKNCRTKEVLNEKNGSFGHLNRTISVISPPFDLVSHPSHYLRLRSRFMIHCIFSQKRKSTFEKEKSSPKHANSEGGLRRNSSGNITEKCQSIASKYSQKQMI